MAVRTLYQLSEKQQEAMYWLGLDPRARPELVVDELGWGGAAGSGKSHLERAVAVTLAQKWPGSYGAIFRRQETQLKRTHVPKLKQELPAALGQWVGSKPPQFHFNSPQLEECMEMGCFPNKPCMHSSIIEFNHVDRDVGVEKYDSVEWNYLIIDERQQFTEKEVAYLRQRIRATKRQIALWGDWHPLVLHGFNPGELDHAYLRREYVKRAEKEGQPWQTYAEDGTEGLVRYFIKALLDENPFIDQEQYIRTLAGGTTENFNRLRYGDWDFFTGQFFKDFKDKVHIVPRFQPPPDWPRAWGFDWGEASPACFLASALDPSTGDIYTYDEYYAPGPTGQHIREILGRLAIMPTVSEGMLPGWADPRMWETMKGDEWNRISVAQQMIQAGVPLQQALGGRDGRLIALKLLQEPVMGHVHPFNGEINAPHWYITSDCPHLIEEIRAAPYEPETDSMVKLNDHAIDAASFHVPRLRLQAKRRRGLYPMLEIETVPA